MKRVIILLFFVIFIFSSCKERVLSRYPDGSIKQKEIVWNRKENLFCVVSYNEDRSVRDSSFFFGDSLARQIVMNDDNRGLKCQYDVISPNERYIRCFYPTGIVHSIGVVYDLDPIGDWKSYYPNGKLHIFESFGSHGLRVFLRRYDEDGNVITTGGSAIYHIHSLCDTIFLLGKKYSSEVFLVDPPDCTVTLYFSELDEQDVRLHTKPMPIHDSRSFVEFSPTEKGTYKIAFDWIIEDKSGEEVLKGSYIQNFIVY